MFGRANFLLPPYENFTKVNQSHHPHSLLTNPRAQCVMTIIEPHIIITTMDPTESKVCSDVMLANGSRLATCKNAVERSAKNLERTEKAFEAAQKERFEAQAAVIRSAKNLDRIKEVLEAHKRNTTKARTQSNAQPRTSNGPKKRSRLQKRNTMKQKVILNMRTILLL